MPTYRVPLTTWADTTVDVTVPEGTDPEEIAKLAEEQVSASLCHKCADVVLGDEWNHVTNSDTGKPEVYRLD